jgi:formamidopyrimidine-DNA glycosylase
MPELPEVETTCRGIRPHVCGQLVTVCLVRNPRLRYPVPPELQSLVGQPITAVTRRAKYLLLRSPVGSAIVHLGMSGSLRICQPDTAWRPHDHVALSLDSGLQLRFHDPRRFGCWLWSANNPADHPLLRNLGPEPLDPEFSAAYLATALASRRSAIKLAIMDNQVVVGVGNIYACESLFLARIHPLLPAAAISRPSLRRLVTAIRTVLQHAIDQGGTTLRDFLRENGQPGYFRQQLNVYDRSGDPCHTCQSAIQRLVVGQRSTWFCPNCQPAR